MTGFGLGGHVLEMAKAGEVHMQIWTQAVPVMDQVLELASMGLVPAGAYANKTHCQKSLQVGNEVDPLLVDVIFDPQTSGGLVLSVPEGHVDQVQAALRISGDLAEVIGQVLPAAEAGAGLSLK